MWDVSHPGHGAVLPDAEEDVPIAAPQRANAVIAVAVLPKIFMMSFSLMVPSRLPNSVVRIFPQLPLGSVPNSASQRIEIGGVDLRAQTPDDEGAGARSSDLARPPDDSAFDAMPTPAASPAVRRRVPRRVERSAITGRRLSPLVRRDNVCKIEQAEMRWSCQGGNEQQKGPINPGEIPGTANPHEQYDSVRFT